MLCYVTLTMQIVYRVHWLRARARMERWKEEVILSEHEMEWTTRYFLNTSRKWVAWAKMSEAEGKLGHASYASRQSAMWMRLADQGHRVFRETLASYPCI
jgi:hypothetical protein